MTPNMKRPLLASVLLIVLAIVPGPAILTAAWHLRHGRTIVFEGRSIVLPLRWYAHIDARTMYFSKLPVTVFGSFPTPASVGPIPGRKPTAASQQEAYGATNFCGFWNFRVN